MPTGPEPVLVSACLLGVACNHKGAASPSEPVRALEGRFRLIPVCPETAGGLPTPRPAAERQADGPVRTASRDDVTAAYDRGARAAVALAEVAGATRAVLKARSPSCGCGQIYDGTFTRRLVAGDGVSAAALIAAGVTVVTEEQVEAGALDP